MSIRRLNAKVTERVMSQPHDLHCGQRSSWCRGPEAGENTGLENLQEARVVGVDLQEVDSEGPEASELSAWPL